jgi:hypothetical protein
MHLVSEANRILCAGGLFYITTPNVLYDQNLVKYFFGGHPFLWSAYTSTYGDRHNREYTTFELMRLLEAGGFTIDRFETLTYDRPANLAHRVAGTLLCLIPAVIGRVPLSMRGAFSHVQVRRSGLVRGNFTSSFDHSGRRSDSAFVGHRCPAS